MNKNLKEEIKEEFDDLFDLEMIDMLGLGIKEMIDFSIYIFRIYNREIDDNKIKQKLGEYFKEDKVDFVKKDAIEFITWLMGEK